MRRGSRRCSLKSSFVLFFSAVALSSSCAEDRSSMKAAVTKQPDYIAYFSRNGARLANRWHIPKPPVQIMRAKDADPPRDVKAEKWTSAFCLGWSDGCMTCNRAHVGDPITCSPRPVENSNDVCKRRNVSCTKTVDVPTLSAVCSHVEMKSIVRYDDNHSADFSAQSGFSWYFDLDDPQPQWSYYIADEPLLPSKRTNSPAKIIAHEQDDACTASFSGSKNDAVFILKRR